MKERLAFDDVDPDAAIPSLIDDVAFIAELDRLEVRGISRPLASPPIARDANRWNLYPPPGVEAEPPQPAASSSNVWLPIVVGLSAGAAASAVLFHERVAQLLLAIAR